MILECVPNFSEGRNDATLDAISRAIETHVPLLHRTSDKDHNRTVYTFAGEPDGVQSAAFAAIAVAKEKIDLRQHTGVHPRFGAADVIPFVPVEGITLDEAATLARDFGRRVWQELGIPIYFYEAAAFERRPLEFIRKNIPLGLQPDFGTGLHPTAGAICLGARKFLIAWNINLLTTSLNVARQIAREIRQSNGGLPGVKALGIALERRGQVQVSINLVDFEASPLHVVFQAVEQRCRALQVDIAGSELIGLMPRAAVELSAGFDLRWLNFTDESILENRLTALTPRPDTSSSHS